MDKHSISLNVNGRNYSREVEPRMLLSSFIREDLGLTGTHIGCDTSSCGACTVMVDGLAVKSCTLLTVQANESEIKTVEGLADGNDLHPLQEGFWEEHGLQCGFCTPGFLITAVQLLERNPNPSEEEIREGLEGNYCRCTGYHNIVKAVQYAAKKMQEGQAIAAD